jgi:hypothetical protein
MRERWGGREMLRGKERGREIVRGEGRGRSRGEEKEKGEVE